MDLHQGRQQGFGPSPISWQDLAAYQQITGEDINRRDVEVLRWIDDEWFASRNEAEERREKGKSDG